MRGRCMNGSYHKTEVPFPSRFISSIIRRLIVSVSVDILCVRIFFVCTILLRTTCGVHSKWRVAAVNKK